MKFSGFTQADFNVFLIDGLQQRMDALQTHIRPKLEFLGSYFAPTLSTMLGNEMHAHVAKHARRTINPPNDTWVAFSSNPRGYKMLPHFQIGLWKTHLFIWFAIIYEAPQKDEMARRLQSQINEISQMIPEDFVWSVDHMKPDVIKNRQLTQEDLQNMFTRLQSVKKAELLCGFQIPVDVAQNMSGQEFVDQCQFVFEKLIPIYKIVSFSRESIEFQ